MNEKRILIKEVIAPCNGCSGAGENVCDNCCDCDMCNSCFTREQTIDKIMRTLCAQVYGPTCEKCEYKTRECKQHRMGYRTYAEAVLNALLEDHDNEK